MELNNKFSDTKPKAVYFYSTCLINNVFPEVGVAAVNILKRAGVKVIIPKKQTCCGQFAFNSGYWDECKDVVKKQIKLFPHDYPIVIPSASCASMMKHHYPKLYQNDALLPQVLNVSSRIYEFTEFLTKVLNIQFEDKGEPIRVAWHSSCKALRDMKVIGDSKQLIRQLKNVELIELERERECCGFGGTFSLKNPEISAVIVHDKVIDVVQTGADILLAGDCGCLVNIDGALKKMEIILPSQHIANFLWERTNR